MTRPLLAAFVTVIASVAVVDASRVTTIPAGTTLRLRLENGISSDESRTEDAVRARLASPLVSRGRTVVAAGSAVLGSVTQSRRSGKVEGRARLGLRFHTLAPIGDAEQYQIRTATWTRIAPSTRQKDVAKIAFPAVGGAILGGLIGGKKGAAIGVAAGGGAGTGVVLSTRGREVRLGRGTVLTVRLTEPLTIHTR
jgi:hypothetical protein